MACVLGDCTIDSLDSSSIVLAVTGDLTDPAEPASPCNGGASIPMGLGPLGSGDVIFKRKFRWSFEVEYCCGSGSPKSVATAFVKSGSRPSINIDEIEINFLNGITWIPGKGKWQTMEIVYYDVAGPNLVGGGTSGLLGWIASVYNFTDPVCLTMGSQLQDYEGTARLTLYDGCGTPVEAWLLQHCWPQAVNWGTLDMSTSEECDITLTLRYTNVCYVSFCPPGSIDVCPCTPCSS